MSQLSDKQLRIALVSDFFYPNTGGIETHIYYIGQCLIKLNHKVIVITHDYGKRRGIRLLSNGLKVYYLPIIFFNNNTLASIPGSLYWFRKIFLDEQIQISFSAMCHEAIFHAWCMGLRTVFTDHSLFGFADASSIFINKLLLKYSLPNVDKLILLRAGLAPDKVFVIPNAINTDLFKPDSVQFYENVTTVVILCRLVYRKGADLLTKVIPLVCQKHLEVRFLIAGDGPKRVGLEEMREKFNLHNRVIMLGVLPHDQVNNLHVVSTNVGGIPEVLPPNFATLVNPNPEDISVAVLKAIKKREAGRLMNPEIKHKKICQMYHWDDVTLRTELVYKVAIAAVNVPIRQRLKNIARAGFWFGIIWIWVAIINILILAIYDFVDCRQLRQQFKKFWKPHTKSKWKTYGLINSLPLHVLSLFLIYILFLKL